MHFILQHLNYFNDKNMGYSIIYYLKKNDLLLKNND